MTDKATTPITTAIPLDQLPPDLAEKVKKHTDFVSALMEAVIERAKLDNTQPILNDHLVFAMAGVILSWQYFKHDGDIDKAMRPIEEAVLNYREAHNKGILDEPMAYARAAEAANKAHAEKVAAEPVPEPAPMPEGEPAQLHDDPDAAALDEEQAVYDSNPDLKRAHE